MSFLQCDWNLKGITFLNTFSIWIPSLQCNLFIMSHKLNWCLLKSMSLLFSSSSFSSSFLFHAKRDSFCRGQGMTGGSSNKTTWQSYNTATLLKDTWWLTQENTHSDYQSLKEFPQSLEWTEMCMRDTTQDIFGGVKWKTSFNFVIF